jgi:hypothetical protein
VPTTALLPFREAQIGDIVSVPELDIAAIPVDQGIESEKLVQFFHLKEGGQTPLKQLRS